MKNMKYFIYFNPLFLIVFIFGCEQEKNEIEDNQRNNAEIKPIEKRSLVSTEDYQLLFEEKISDWHPPQNMITAQISQDVTYLQKRVNKNGRLLDCNYETRNVTQYVSELPAWVDSLSSLLPGMIINTTELSKGNISAIPTGDRDVTLYTSTGIKDPYITVKRANSASIRKGLNELKNRIHESKIPIPSTVSFSAYTITSQSEFQDKMNLTAGIANAASSNSLKFGESSSGSEAEKQKYIVIRMIQPMYTIVFSDDIYPQKSKFFGAINKALWTEYDSDIWMEKENPPSFISSVVFGRMILFSVKVDESISNNQINQSLGLKANNGKLKGDLSFGNGEQFSKAILDGRLKAIVLGGTETDAFSAISNGDFSHFFKAQDIRTAVPLHYIAKHITSNRPVVAFRDTFNYTVTDCYRCVETKETRVVSYSKRVNAYKGDASIKGCDAKLNVTIPNQSCNDLYGEALLPSTPRKRKGYRLTENRLGQCNIRWTNNEPSDCSVSLWGRDERDAFGGVCEVACTVQVDIEYELPNQPPVCQYPM